MGQLSTITHDVSHLLLKFVIVVYLFLQFSKPACHSAILTTYLLVDMNFRGVGIIAAYLMNFDIIIAIA